MEKSDFFEILFILAIVAVPVIKKLFTKEKSWNEKIDDLKFLHPEFFKTFPALDNSEKLPDFEMEIFNIGKCIRENEKLKKHEPAYIELSKIIFKY